MKSESYWKSKLTPEQYNICRLQGTEPAFSGIYNKHDKNGTYCCVACETPLFESQYKYDSGSGWPSFTKSIKDTIIYKEDISHGMRRVEVQCANCQSHLGHVFPDGPQPTGTRYCINSLSLNFKKI